MSAKQELLEYVFSIAQSKGPSITAQAIYLAGLEGGDWLVGQMMDESLLVGLSALANFNGHMDRDPVWSVSNQLHLLSWAVGQLKQLEVEQLDTLAGKMRGPVGGGDWEVQNILDVRVVLPGFLMEYGGLTL